MSKPVCLDLGSGEFPIKLESHQVIKVDVRKSANPDLLCDVRKLPYPDNSIDSIYAGHILEHFSFREVDEILNVWVKILKQGGDLYVKVPNTKHLCEQILLDNEEPDKIFGVPPIVALFGSHENKYQYHYNAFTVKSLLELMQRHGVDGTCMLMNENREIVFDGTKL
jgi:predicted SAM-dependent methyltransferase